MSPAPAVIETIGAVAATAGTFTPASLPSLVAWWKADDAASITASGGLVSQWNSQVNGHQVQQSTAGTKPATGAVTQNGLNVISGFGAGGVDKFLTLVGGSTATFAFLHKTASSVYCVARSITNPGAAFALLSTCGVATSQVGYLFGIGYAASSAYQLVVNGSATVVDDKRGSWGTTAFQQFSTISDPANGTAAQRSAIYQNGTLQTQGNTSSATPSAANSQATLYIGSSYMNEHWTGEIAEIIITSALPTGSNRTDCEAYLKARWGTP